MMNTLFDASNRQELRWTDPAAGAAMPLTLLAVSSRSVDRSGDGKHLLSAEEWPVGAFGMGSKRTRAADAPAREPGVRLPSLVKSVR